VKSKQSEPRVDGNNTVLNASTICDLFLFIRYLEFYTDSPSIKVRFPSFLSLNPNRPQVLEIHTRCFMTFNFCSTIISAMIGPMNEIGLNGKLHPMSIGSIVHVLPFSDYLLTPIFHTASSFPGTVAVLSRSATVSNYLQFSTISMKDLPEVSEWSWSSFVHGVDPRRSIIQTGPRGILLTASTQQR